MHSDYGGDAENASLPTPNLAKLMRVAYAVAYMNVQGRTISDEAVVLWDTLRPGGRVRRCLTLRHFIMGVQRIVKPEQLKIAAYEQAKAFLGVDVPEPEEPEDERDDGESDKESDDEAPPEKRRRVA